MVEHAQAQQVKDSHPEWGKPDPHHCHACPSPGPVEMGEADDSGWAWVAMAPTGIWLSLLVWQSFTCCAWSCSTTSTQAASPPSCWVGLGGSGEQRWSGLMDLHKLLAALVVTVAHSGAKVHEIQG